PITWLVPAFGGRHAPAEVRVGLGLALALLSLPRLLAAAPVESSPAIWILLVARELLVGVALGLVVSFIFRAAEAAGRLTDILRGANMAEVLSPSSEERTSPMGDLAMLLFLVVFVELGGIGYLATALARSYEAVPIGGAVSGEALRSAAGVVMAASAQLLES